MVEQHMEDHFEAISRVYSDVRTTDQEPIEYIRESLRGISPIRGADIGCGSGRYSKLLFDALADLSLTCVDSSRSMLEELENALKAQGFSQFEVIHSEVNQLELGPASCDFISSFNAVHHFDLLPFLARVSGALKPSGQGFVYTRTPSQNGANIWGQYFPHFLERETRLYKLSDLVRGVEETSGLEMAAARSFRFPRVSTLDRLLFQARNRHYSTFSLYSTQEFKEALSTFEESLRKRFPDPGRITWTDGNTMLHFQRQEE